MTRSSGAGGAPPDEALQPTNIWLASSLMLVAAFTSYFVGSLIQQQRLPPEVSTLIYRPLAMFVRVLMIASILAGLINGTAILFPPQEGVYFFAILGPLVAGATIFLRIVFVRPAA